MGAAKTNATTISADEGGSCTLRIVTDNQRLYPLIQAGHVKIFDHTRYRSAGSLERKLLSNRVIECLSAQALRYNSASLLPRSLSKYNSLTSFFKSIPGDGIVPIGCDRALIEHNIMRDSPDILPETEAAAGIWPWSSDNTIIQFNEVSGHKAKWDGQGFDSDWNCFNTIIQYNYSHDNYGGFLLICNNGENINTKHNAGTVGTIVRYNVSINDGLRPYPTAFAGYFSPVFHISGPCTNTQIHNNIIVVKPKASPQIDRTLVKMDNWGGPWPDHTDFRNNIFYALDSCTLSFGSDKSTTFSNNTFYGPFKGLPPGVKAVYTDPFECIPEGHGRTELLKCLRLQQGISSMNSGTDVGSPDFEDFFKN